MKYKVVKKAQVYDENKSEVKGVFKEVDTIIEGTSEIINEQEVILLNDGGFVAADNVKPFQAQIDLMHNAKSRSFRFQKIGFGLAGCGVGYLVAKSAKLGTTTTALSILGGMALGIFVAHQKEVNYLKSKKNV